MRPEATVDAAAEGDVAVDLAVEAHLVGVGELGLVGVGRSDHDHDLVAGLDRAAVELGVLDGHPGDTHDRRLPAQQLLDGVGDERRVLDQLAPVVGVLGQEREHAVERGRDGVEAGDEEQEADVQDVLAGEPVALHLGVEEVREQVVPPLHLALVEDLVEVVVDRVGDLLLVVAGLARAVELPGHVVGPDDAVLHGEEPVQLVEGQAQAGSGRPGRGTGRRTPWRSPPRPGR